MVGATSITWWNCERISPLALMPAGPVHDRAVARAAEVRRDLLGPLIGRIERVRPADGVVVERRARAQFVHAFDQQLWCREIGSFCAGLVVPGADQRALGRGAVVADDVVDERVVQDLQIASDR
jgi:hypothetical protein